MRNLDSYNERMVETLRDNWLDQDRNFFGANSTKVDREAEKEEEEYEFSEDEIERIKSEWQVDDLAELDKYDWSEILEEFVGEFFVTDNIVKIELESKTITYRK